MLRDKYLNGNKYKVNEIFNKHNKYKTNTIIIINNVSINECKFFLKNVVKKEIDNLNIIHKKSINKKNKYT
mgnify:CR=1 FL=1|tara:strand:- start:429 stop:641 length:213 start_codon:yes stop_codon:yes gene_type:complete